jgi:hypothetical protein
MTTSNRLSVVTPADWIPGPAQGEWTYEVYVAIPVLGHRYEVVDGVLYMPPAPTWDRQSIVGEIYTCLRTLLRTLYRIQDWERCAWHLLTQS